MAATNNIQMKDQTKSKTIRQSDASHSTTSESTGRRINGTNDKHESVIFIWFHPHEQSNTGFIGQLRAINDSVQTFTDVSLCCDTLRSSREKIFFICSSNNNELISTAHDQLAVEAIFILDPNIENVKGDFPKLFGIFIQQEELLRILKEVFETFEQTQLEEFAFEEDKIFLWSQLWKEDLSSRKGTSNRQGLIDMARSYYRDNTRINGLIEELEKSYRPAEVITWCLRSPFPTRFLLHALRSHNAAQLNPCRFLFADASRFFHQHLKHKSSDQVYRGMKLSSELLDQFEAHVGQLVCTSGFFLCTKSRTHALSLAGTPGYRSDLLPVLFKIDCDAASLFTEITNNHASSTIVFDVCLAFRVVYVNRSQMSVIKLKTAGEEGKKFTLEYLQTHKGETTQSLLVELIKPPKPSTPPPPPPRTPTPPPPPRVPTPPQPTTVPVPVQNFEDSTITLEERKAMSYLQQGETDLALATYLRIKPVTVRILNAIGKLCAERKGDYDYALQCHTQALKMQEESHRDPSDTHTYIGNVYYNRHEFDLALDHYSRALELHETNSSTESVTIASDLLGLAKAHWARHEHSKAIMNAARALTLQEALVPPNERNVATTLILLGKIYRDSGDNTSALDLCTRARTIVERITPIYYQKLADLIYTIGTIQLNLGMFNEAYDSFKESVHIYRRLVPRGHSDRTLAENELQRIYQLLENTEQNSQIYS